MNENDIMPKKDYFWRFYKILFGVMLGLLALYLVPSQIGSWWDIKPIDMLSDLRTEYDEPTLDPLLTEDVVDSASVSLPEPKIKAKEVARREKNEAIYNKIVEQTVQVQGEVNTQIVDYSAERTGLKHFFSQLNRREQLGRPVRIAVLGDSFVEADIFTDAVRLGLQERYGGGGVGWLPMSSPVAGYRQSVRHQQKGWKDISVMDKTKRRHTIAGHLFEASAGAWSGYSVPEGGRQFSEVTLYYHAPGESTMLLSTDEQMPPVVLKATDETLGAEVVYSGVALSDIRLTMERVPEGFVSYGVALEQSEGISLDNMSLRGSSGLNLAGLSEELNREFARLRPYDLIILQYGLNVANAKQKNYKGYASNMRKSIMHLRALFPQADIMLLGVSDRAQRSSGELRTMEAIELLDAEQRKLAESLGITYFSLLNAMRSLGGVVEMSKRGETSKDYTHLSHKGGKKLAPVFLAALELEKRYYDELHN